MTHVSKRNRSGFSLVELMIVLSVLAVLAALVVPRFQSIQTEARAVAAAESLKAIASAVKLYEASNGDYPSDSAAGSVPAEVQANLPNADFTRAPLGGQWDYDEWFARSHKAGGDIVDVAISIVDGDATLYQVIDDEIDDGDLATGNVRFCEDQPRLMYVIKFR